MVKAELGHICYLMPSNICVSFESDLNSREQETCQPVHVVNVDIQDNHEEATLGAFLICELCQCVSLRPRSRHPYQGSGYWARGGGFSSLATYFHILVNTKFQRPRSAHSRLTSDFGLSASVVGGSDV